MPTRNAELEQELQEARRREADDLADQNRRRALSGTLRLRSRELRERLRQPQTGWRSSDELLATAAAISQRALGNPRTSVWLFDTTRRALICRILLPFEGAERAASELPAPRIETADCPGYIAALSLTESGAVAVNDAQRDPRTSELLAYLRQNNVGALLDIPILGPGNLHGVICHEHLGGVRHWQEEEIDFATDVGATLALVLEAERRVLAERAVRGTEAKYQHLVESLPVTVYSFQAKTGALEYVSPRVRELAGLAPEAYLLAGGIERWVDVIHPDDREPVRRRLEGKIEDGIAEELVYRIRLPDGGQRWVRDTCAVVRDAKGVPFAIQGTLADVTSLREAEQARVELERQFQTLLENVDLLAIVLTAKGRLSFVNDCFVRLTGYSRADAIGADGFALVLPESDRARVRTDFFKSLSKGTIVPRFESTIQTRSGDVRRILWTNTLIRDGRGEVSGTASLGVDITERLEAEASQLERQKLESLGRLAATVAHDFNNLLMVVSGAMSLLGDAQNPQDASLREEIDLAVKQASGLTRALLAYARKERIVPELLNVDAVISGVLPVLTKLAPPEIALSFSLAHPTAQVVMDGTQLRQILMNLVGNAVDATRRHGTRVTVSTQLVSITTEQARLRALTTEGSFVLLSVADDGVGMTPDLVDRAFDPFFTTKAKGEGTGLGLATVGSIARRAGGFVTVESLPGQGSVFRVYLPLAIEEAWTAAMPMRDVGGSPLAAPKVLICDESESVRNLVGRVLSARGFDVVEAATSEVARQCLDESAVDLLMTDTEWQNPEGQAFLRYARKQGRARHVIVLTADGSRGVDPAAGPTERGETRDAAARGGNEWIDAWVAKPFPMQGLVSTVARVLATDQI